MATRSVIAYEDEEGNCVGVYCHYDGYPKHMFPIVDTMSYDDVRTMVEYSLVNGGIRGIESDGEYETFNEPSKRHQWLHTSVFANLNGVDYTYIKKKDGSIFATAYDGSEIENPY